MTVTEVGPYMAAVAAHGDYTWTPVYSNKQGISTLAAVKAYLGTNGNVDFITACTIYLNRLGELLGSLQTIYGANGIALILDSSGYMITSTVPSQVTDAKGQSLVETTDPDLSAIATPLIANGLLNGNPPTSSPGDFVQGGLFDNISPAFSAVSIGLDSGSYELQAAVLDAVGVRWIVVVLTKDSDFDGDIAYHNLVTGGFSLLVLVVSMVVMIAITQCLSRPLRILLKYMTQVAHIGQQTSYSAHYDEDDEEVGEEAKEGGGSKKKEEGENARFSDTAYQLAELKKIYAAYHADMNLTPHDSAAPLFDASAPPPQPGPTSLRQTHRMQAQVVNPGDSAVISNRTDPSEGASLSSRLRTSSSSLSSSFAESVSPSSQPFRSSGSALSVWLDRAAVLLMREVEDLQLTFHSMLYQLTKSHQQLEDANQQKRHFIRYIFHEVRVPLNAVMLGLADLRASSKAPNEGDSLESVDVQALLTQHQQGNIKNSGWHGATSMGASSSKSAMEWTDEQRDVLSIVYEQSQVVGRILNDVLSLHKIEDGALQLQFAPFSLESMLLATMQSFMPGIVEKRIHYTAEFQPVQWFVWGAERMKEAERTGQRLDKADVIGDKYRLRQVLANFLSNAIKFSPIEGAIHVTLSIFPPSSVSTAARQSAASAAAIAKHHELPSIDNDTPVLAYRKPLSLLPLAAFTQNTTAEGATPDPPLPREALFRVSVRDTGVGISAADQDKLFSPYMQVLPGELQKGAGTGQTQKYTHPRQTVQSGGPAWCSVEY